MADRLWPMVTTAAEYRQYARECLQAVKLATTQEVETVLLDMAARWNELAERADRNAHLRGDAPNRFPPI